MKKLTSLFLAVVVFMLSLSCVYAEGEMQFIVGSKEVYMEDASQSVEIPLSFKSNPGFASFQIEIGYNSKYFEPTAVSKTMNIIDSSLVKNFNPEEADGTPINDTIILSGACDYNMEFEGEFVNLKFKVKEDAPSGTYPVTIKYQRLASVENVNGKDEYTVLDVAVQNGAITVTRPSKPAEVKSVGMVDTAIAENGDPSITSFMTTIETNDTSFSTLTWNIKYGDKENSYKKDYGTVFTDATVKIGLYVENLYVADKNSLEVGVELGKGE